MQKHAIANEETDMQRFNEFFKEQTKLVLVIMYHCFCARKWVYLYYVSIPK